MALRVIATGGTIASLPDPATGAVRPAVAVADLIAGVPGLDRLGPIQAEEVAHVNGWNMTPATMLQLAERVDAALADDTVRGVVVTHGTDTVEETAFLCDLTVASDKPVAFAVAMRSGAELAADGPRNLLGAAQVASDVACRGLGSVLVVGDEVHAARWVRKLDSFRVSAFGSPDRGPLGVVTPGHVRVLRAAPARHALPRPEGLDRAVPIVQTYTGIEEHAIDAVCDAAGAAGLVVEGTGLGNVPGTAMPAIERALGRGVVVAVATRVPTGGTGAVYGGPGGGATLRDLGVLAAGGLSAAKARLLLMLILASTRDPSEASRQFARAIAALA